MTVEHRRITGVAEPDDIEDSYPLSPMQQGMLFHTLSSRQSGVDIEQMFFAIRANINRQAFRVAWEHVIRQHAVLRTSFHWEGLDEPRQHVHKRGRLDLEEADWRGLDEREQKGLLENYLRRDRLRGFQLTRESLMRVALFQIGESVYSFIWTFHHALLDGRSLVRVLEQVYAAYEGLGRGETPRSQSAGDYREHIRFLGSLDTGRDERFWREMLEGFTAPTPLPAGNGVQPTADSRAGHCEQEISISATSAHLLKALASECRVTLYTLVQAAWALLLSRYSGEQDIVYGATRACRSSAADGGESPIGLFINTLPVRIRVPDDMQVQQWLREIRSLHLALREFEHTPLERIQRWSEIQGGRPLFESLLVFENYDLRTLLQTNWSGWEILTFKFIEQTNYPLALSCWSGEELLLKIEYDRLRFSEATIGRMLGHLKTILLGILSSTAHPVSNLGMLTEAERRQLVVDWNATETNRPSNGCVHQLFEAQAARTPNVTAVISEDEQLSYRELNARANRLARHLRSVGVSPETLVGISIGRSIEMIVGVLAILKSGGAYLPLDPTYPKERIAAMLEDSGAPVLLTLRRFVGQLPKTDAAVICLDAEWDIIARKSTEDPNCVAKPESLAYVIYTSGSSGRPKGVLIEHRSLSNYIETAADEFALEPGDRVLQFASISFDTSAEEIFTCLARGATLVLRTDSMLDSVSTFLQQCKDSRVTVLDLPTAYWHELTAGLAGGGLSLPSSIRLIIIGGEPAVPERVAEWQNRVRSGVRLLNTYGPTETTIVATMADLSAARPIDFNGNIAVGRPIANVRTYVLDGHHQPAPVGVTGELWIGGAGLARGYLNRPELTQKKFIPDPFRIEPGARLYRTGDLARYLEDGSLQLAGRIDDQVKINGFRVELGEIEAALRSNPHVREAIVLAREDRPGDRRLVAYVVPRQGANSPDRLELRDELHGFLKKKLPRYMLPPIFVALDTLPISLSGKVDRNGLPPPDPFQTGEKRNYARPRDPLEKHLVEIWEEILNVRPIGIRDNFFDLGGHSLLSVRMMDRIEQAFGRKLPLAILFDDATVEYLAARLLEEHKAGQQAEVVEIQKGGSRRPFFFLHGDFNGGGFYCLNLARGLGADQPFYALQPHGLDGGPIPATIEAMAERHLSALRSFQPQGPYLLGGYCNGATIAFEVARQLQAQGETTDLLVLLCTSARNVRFRLLECTLGVLTNLDGLGPEARLRRFLAVRERIARVAEIRNYYRSQLAELSRMRPRQKIAIFRQKAGRALVNMVRTLASAFRNGNSHAASSRARSPIGLPGDRREYVGAAYDSAMRGYVPKPYRGRVTLLWPEELPRDDPDDPSAGWRQVAAEVDVHAVSGGHISCVTSNVHNLAETLRACLEKTQAAMRNQD